MDPHAAIWEHCLEPAGLSDIGLRRSNNQDSLAVMLASSQEKWEERGHLFVVADGMGAHAAGELASKLATDLVPLTYGKLLDRDPPEALLAAVRDANAQIHNRGTANDDFRGMGTTLSVLVLTPLGALVGHVGDSRVYRVRGTRLEQLTFDHSLVWELRAAKHAPDSNAASFIPKNIITRSLGPNAQVQVDIEGPLPIETGDSYLLCSDGLSGQVNDDEIGRILMALPPKEAVRALVDLANLRGGPDNVTVIVVKVLGPQVAREKGSAPAKAQRPHNRPPVHPAVWSTLGVLALSAAVLVTVGQRIAAVAALIGAIGAGVFALLQKFGGGASHAAVHPRLGRGPYVVCDCPLDASFPARLAVMDQQLRDAATNADWAIDWDAFCQHEGLAAAAVRDGKFLEATREYCRAISCMMEQLRHQTNRKQGLDRGPSKVP
jgi:protein phosphatase